MKKNKLVPRLRFQEFKNSPSWDIKKFDFQFLPTNTFSRSEMNNNKGIVKNIHYGDILIKYNYILDNTSLIPFINEDINLNKFTKESYLQNGDIIIADTAEDFSAGKAIEVQNINCKVLSGQHTFLCRPQTKYAPKFLGYYLNSPLYHNYLTKFLTGTKVYSINKTNIKNTFIIYPDNLEEQKKIADCLDSIDELIEAEKRKLVVLKKYKKALMQKLFPAEDASIPELRFAEFKDSGEWENKKLSEIGKFIRGFSYKGEDTTNDTSKLLIIRSNNIIPMGITDYKNGLQYVQKPCKEEQKLITGDITICMANGSRDLVGKASFYDGMYSGDITVGAFCGIFRSKLNITRYLFQTNLYKKKLDIILSGGNGSIANLRGEDILNLSFYIPNNFQEQKKIADCLSSIDSIIDSQVKRIDNLIKHKNALMQGLFPDMESIEEYE